MYYKELVLMCHVQWTASPHTDGTAIMPDLMRNRTMKRNALYTFDGTASQGAFVFSDGATIAVKLADLQPAMVEQLAMHGWKQKVADAAAKGRDPETGRAASDAEKIAAMQAVADRIASGTFNATGGGGGVSLVVMALAELSGKSIADAREYYAGKTKAEQAALAANARVKVIVDRLTAERVERLDVDSDALLDEFAD
jgi:hypothetical protein